MQRTGRERGTGTVLCHILLANPEVTELIHNRNGQRSENQRKGHEAVCLGSVRPKTFGTTKLRGQGHDQRHRLRHRQPKTVQRRVLSSDV